MTGSQSKKSSRVCSIKIVDTEVKTNLSKILEVDEFWGIDYREINDSRLP